MKEIISEDECNDTYGRIRMYQALLLKQPEGVHIPSERTVIPGYGSDRSESSAKEKAEWAYKGRPGKPMKSDDLLKRDFHSDAPLEKCIYRYHGDSGVQWETVCICDIRLL